jgi:electron transfer flavoprotein beta subunit
VEVLVCVKRVPAPGGRINLTDDGLAIDTRHLGFTISPHEECAVEEAVRIVEQHGGSATVLTVGPEEAEEQLRQSLALGADRAVHIVTGDGDPDPQATARVIADTVATLAEEGRNFDLLLFGDESADAGGHQVGIRVAHALGIPIVGGVKGVEITDGTVTLRREVPDGYEIYEVSTPAAAAVKEGLNLPRYPSLKGRLRARNAELLRIDASPAPGGLRTLKFAQPPQEESETVILGSGPDAAPRIVELFEELELL